MSPQSSVPGGSAKRYYGKYRGLVVQNIDPLQMGRVQVQCSDVFGEGIASWAMLCVPTAGLSAGIFAVPPIDSQVWIEFEQGDPDYPICAGAFWGTTAAIPVFALVPPAIPPGQNIVIQTTGQNMVAVSDSPPTPVSGGIVLKSTTGAMIVVNDVGIFIDNGKGASITLIGPLVDINNTALTIAG